jgi:hypothetical protein
MTIEFHCPACRQPLRVPDEAAGKNGKCPQCATIFVVPQASNLPPPASAGGGPLRNPFADDPQVNPYDVGGIPARNYPEIGHQQPLSSELPVMPQGADAGAIISFSFTLWQRHLGLLVGTHLIILVIMVILAIGHTSVLTLLELDPFDQGFAHYFANAGMGLFNSIVQTYLWIGQLQICLKLGRNQPAEFADLFLGSDRFFPTVGAWLLVVMPVYAVNFLVVYLLSFGSTFGNLEFGVALGYGVLYLLASLGFAVFFWPFPYLVIDRKTTVLGSYGAAFQLTQINIGTTILLAIVSVAILLLGLFACYVGLIFAIPLVTVLWSTAYLMMAGQIPMYNWLR